MRDNFRRCASLVAATLCLVASAGGVQAQQAKPPAKPASKAPPMLDAVIESKAIDLLKATSSRLAAAKSMKFSAVVSYEAPSRFGPPLVYTTKSDVTMQRPDKLKIITPSDGPASEFYYDGKVMMAFSPAENLLAVGDAPPTIDDMLQYAFHSAELHFPYSDLLISDPYTGLAHRMEIAFYIGQSKTVGGTTTDMVAFASNEVFVQMWLGAEDKLPRKMRAVYRKDPLKLRHDMELSNWQLDAGVKSEEFATEKAKGAKRIKFAAPSTKVVPGSKPPAKSAPAKTK